jgi:UPF0271 protein
MLSRVVRWVLDTSALFILQEMPTGEVYTSPGVLRELDEHGDNRIPFFSELFSVLTPSKKSLDAVGAGAMETGDDARLSPVDLELVALAYELEATLMSDDYSIQNLASHMGIGFMPVGKKGISRKLRWRYKCTGCGRIWKDLHPECPVCGASLRSFRSKK